MRVLWKPTTFGLQATPGWLVFFDKSVVAAISASEDGTVDLQWGHAHPWVCVSITWENLDAAKAEFQAWAKAYSRGLTPAALRKR